ncbi:hypothetical protein [Glaciihabitans sp. UYNi722]|uniref:hypothetical protein n=1 Tax=Glaciihabitans sp. UYNi722 TaxID=3156344 RepID=UPI00339B4F3E
MAIQGRFVAAIALVMSAILLAGCTTAPAKPLISQEKRALIRSQLLDKQWRIVARQYPEAIRPVVSSPHIVSNHEWPQAVVDCLGEHGIKARVLQGGLTYLSGSGQTQLEYTVESYNCAAQYVTDSDVLRLLSPRLAEADYQYLVTVVRPCLLVAGAPSPASPNREIAKDINGLAGWNPFQVIWAGNYPRSLVRYWEDRCPPVPGWLDIGE